MHILNPIPKLLMGWDEVEEGLGLGLLAHDVQPDTWSTRIITRASVASCSIVAVVNICSKEQCYSTLLCPTVGKQLKTFPEEGYERLTAATGTMW